MKVSKIAILFLFTVTSGFAQHATFSFKRKTSDIGKDDWYRMVIPNDMLSKVNRDFSDLRLYTFSSTDTVEIPYLLKVMEDKVIDKTVDLPVLNKSTKNGQLFFSFDTKGQPVNFLDLHFAEPNFNAFVKIEGSHDQRDWFELVNNQRILSVDHDGIQFKITKVRFPESTYRFLRIALKSDLPLTLTQASFKNQVAKPGVSHTFAPSWSAENDAKAKQTVITARFAEASLVNQLDLNVKSAVDYYRHVTIEYLSDSSKTPKGWTYFYAPLYNGYLTSVQPNIFYFNSNITKQIRLTISNADNLPLTISGLKASGPAIILLAKLKPSDVYLCYGNPDVYSPSYDLVHFEDAIPDSVSTLSLGNETVIEHSVEVKNPLFSNKRWLWVMISVAIAVLGYFTVKMMRNQ